MVLDCYRFFSDDTPQVMVRCREFLLLRQNGAHFKNILNLVKFVPLICKVRYISFHYIQTFKLYWHLGLSAIFGAPWIYIMLIYPIWVWFLYEIKKSITNCIGSIEIQKCSPATFMVPFNFIADVAAMKGYYSIYIYDTSCVHEKYVAKITRKMLSIGAPDRCL